MNILIGGAWPYANGSLHIGHLAGLLPGDVLARYHRAIGDRVYYVSGSDCHGTPVAIRAKQENRSPEEICERYHQEFQDCFTRLGFSYDRYGKTSSEEHRNFVQSFHRTLYEGSCIYEKEAPQAYCGTCGKNLSDRFVVGRCPSCGETTRGDQCDACGTVLEPEHLIEPVCSVCENPPVFHKAKHLFLALSALEQELTTHLDKHPEWRKNARAFTKRYIRDGLRDRAITRDLDWGIDVPKEGYEGKKIYIWAENVLGYLSMSKTVADTRGESFADLWGTDSRHYYVHGKDNIPFHTIILPALLLGHGGAWRLPDTIISNEYLTLEGRKISTSQNWAIWVKDLLNRYHPDSIRYFLITNGPEKRDTDFSWNAFVNSHNGELLGAYGNFINRILAFVYKYYDAAIPDGTLDVQIAAKIQRQYKTVGCLIEEGRLKEALDGLFDFIRYGNRYFDSQKPWETRETDSASCRNTLHTCVQMIANLAVLLHPFLPFSSERIMKWLGLEPVWAVQNVSIGYRIPRPDILFERLDKDVIEKEKRRLEESCTS